MFFYYIINKKTQQQKKFPGKRECIGILFQMTVNSNMTVLIELN